MCCGASWKNGDLLIIQTFLVVRVRVVCTYMDVGILEVPSSQLQPLHRSHLEPGFLEFTKSWQGTKVSSSTASSRLMFDVARHDDSTILGMFKQSSERGSGQALQAKGSPNMNMCVECIGMAVSNRTASRRWDEAGSPVRFHIRFTHDRYPPNKDQTRASNTEHNPETFRGFSESIRNTTCKPQS